MNVRSLLLSTFVVVFAHIQVHAAKYDAQAGSLGNNLEHHHHKHNPAKANNHANNHTKQLSSKTDDDTMQEGHGVSLMWGDELEEFEPEAQ